MSSKKVKMVRAVEMKQRIDQKATQPRANCLAESEKNVCDGTGQVEDALVCMVVEVGSLGLGEAAMFATRGSSRATQLLPVSSLSGYLYRCVNEVLTGSEL